jgi:putative PIN family toxin of toxin-antitoxin system
VRLVIDTNIIVSALLSEHSRAFQVLSDALDGKYTVLISKEIFQEYQDVLHRDKFGFDEDIINFILTWFQENAVWVEVPKSDIPMPDNKDRAFYDLAKSCKARLLTGNIKHYPVDELVTALWELT